VSAAPAAPARHKQRYVDEVRPQLMERFGYSTVMQAPKIEKITLNMGVGEAKQDSKLLDAASEHVWLYNLYNFVPYPKTPLFPTLKERIVDWDFQNWREDRPVVYEPYHQSRERSWAHFLRIVERATELLERTECPRPASRNQVGGRL